MALRGVIYMDRRGYTGKVENWIEEMEWWSGMEDSWEGVGSEVEPKV